MSTVSSVSSSYYSNALSSLFSKIDTSNKGYIEESDLESAFSSLVSDSSSTSSTSDVSSLFSQLDTDSDGKVTESEFSTSLSNLASALDDQYNQSRMEGAMGGMPPPPPPSEDSDSTSSSENAYTADELTAQLSEIGSTDSARSSLISSILSNFDSADTDSDGSISDSEAMSYASANGLGPDSSSTSAVNSSAESSAAGFTADELTAQLSEIGSTDSARSTLISSILDNFEAADTNQDGTVSNSEAMAYAQNNNISTNESSNSSSSNSSSSNSSSSDAQVFQQIMQLMSAYGIQSSENNMYGNLSSLISTSA